jgi:hypothetical protein
MSGNKKAARAGKPRSPCDWKLDEFKNFYAIINTMKFRIALILALFLAACAHTAPAPQEPPRTPLPEKFHGIWYPHPGKSSKITMDIRGDGTIIETSPYEKRIVDYKVIHRENSRSFFLLTRQNYGKKMTYSYLHYEIPIYAPDIKNPTRFYEKSGCYARDPAEWFWSEEQYRRRIFEPTENECDIQKLYATSPVYRE